MFLMSINIESNYFSSLLLFKLNKNRGYMMPVGSYLKNQHCFSPSNTFMCFEIIAQTAYFRVKTMPEQSCIQC